MPLRVGAAGAHWRLLHARTTARIFVLELQPGSIFGGREHRVSTGHKEGEGMSRKQILKCRDDAGPVIFDQQSGDEPVFALDAAGLCSWAKGGETFGPERLRPRIEPWLTALCQAEHMSLLIGSGLTHAVNRLGGCGTLPGMDSVEFSTFGAEIAAEAKRSATRAGRQEGNIEDQIRVANELLRGLEILGSTARSRSLRRSLEMVLSRIGL